MSHKIRNLVLAATFAIGVTGSGAVVANALAAVPTPQPTGSAQTGPSVNDNVDDGEKGQSGVQQTGEAVTDNKNDGDQGQVGVQASGGQANENKDDGASGQTGANQ
jgi:hypothetical protein